MVGVREGLRREVSSGPRPERQEEGSHAEYWRESIPAHWSGGYKGAQLGHHPMIRSQFTLGPRLIAPTSQLSALALGLESGLTSFCPRSRHVTFRDKMALISSGHLKAAPGCNFSLLLIGRRWQGERGKQNKASKSRLRLSPRPLSGARGWG